HAHTIAGQPAFHALDRMPKCPTSRGWSPTLPSLGQSCVPERRTPKTQTSPLYAQLHSRFRYWLTQVRLGRNTRLVRLHFPQKPGSFCRIGLEFLASCVPKAE